MHFIGEILFLSVCHKTITSVSRFHIVDGSLLSVVGKSTRLYMNYFKSPTRPLYY